MEISKTFRFEASHVLPKHPGKCSRLHGHSWVLTAYVKGPINPETHFVMDYGDISYKVGLTIELLDHCHLNDLVDYPSSEELLIYIGTLLLYSRGSANSLEWSKLELEETCTSKAILTREEFNNALSNRGDLPLNQG